MAVQNRFFVSVHALVSALVHRYDHCITLWLQTYDTLNLSPYYCIEAASIADKVNFAVRRILLTVN